MALASASVLLLYCSSLAAVAGGNSPAQAAPELLGLPAIPTCDGSSAIGRLGEKLFRDTRLSADRGVSCATCHDPERAFTDGRPVAQGTGGKSGTRNSPTLINAQLLTAFSWDGRQGAVEDQAAAAFVNSREHGLADHEALLALIKADASYLVAFNALFLTPADREAASLQHVKDALRCFIQSLAAGNSAFDRYAYRGERGALSAAQRRGLELFRGRANCASCHPIGEREASFTDNLFHSIHVPSPVMRQLPSLLATVAATRRDQLGELIVSRADVAALGRFVVTQEPADLGRFRTPSLRNVAITAPYLHDGSVATLSEAVEREVYYRSVGAEHPVILTPSERDDVIAFLESLTSRKYASLSR